MKETKLDKMWHEEKYLLKGAKSTKKAAEAGRFHAKMNADPHRK